MEIGPALPDLHRNFVFVPSLAVGNLIPKFNVLQLLDAVSVVYIAGVQLRITVKKFIFDLFAVRKTEISALQS